MGQRYSDYRHLILPGNKENILILILKLRLDQISFKYSLKFRNFI